MRPYHGSEKKIAPLEWTQTSFGLFSSLPSKWLAIVSRVPSGRSRTSELVTCSQTRRLRSASYVRPLHLLDGLITSSAPEPGVYFRRVSPGMSEKSR